MRCVQFVSVKKIAGGLALAAALLGVSLAEADGRPRYRASFGPVPYRQPVAHWRRYFGPVGSYGSPYYALANRPYFYPPPVYGPYGYESVVGNQYPRPNYAPDYGGPYAAFRGPGFLNFDPYANPALQETMLENQLRWGMNLPPNVPPLRTRVRLRPSTPEQQVKSIHAQAQGDVWMRKLKFLNAYERYKYAVSAANDRPEPYFRLGYALAAIGSFDSGVKYIKQGLDLDPQWPSHGERLEAIFGDDNRLAILSLIERVTGWVREDIRDPDRLFLVGVLLHFNGDNRASQFFEAAYRLAGGGDHLLAFLQPPADNRDAGPAPAQPGGPPGQYPGTAPSPAPAEPPLPLEAIPGAALTPPGRNPQSPVAPPGAVPNNPRPDDRVPNKPVAPPLPDRASPQSRPLNATPPAGSPPRSPVPPAAPALPLPPLPAADNSGAAPQSNSQTVTGGPLLSPSSGNNTAAQSP